MSKSVLKGILIYKTKFFEPPPEPYFATQLPFVTQDENQIEYEVFYPRFGEVGITVTFTSSDIS